MNVGKVLDSDVLLITTHIGSAEGGKGGGYKMSLINANTPAVKSVKTGKTFYIPWDEIIKLGVDAGIDS